MHSVRTTVMEVKKCLVVVVVVVLVSLAHAEDLRATGWCCPVRKGGGGGCSWASTGDFKPIIFPREKKDAIITWKTRAVTCPPGSSLVRYDNATTHSDFTLPDQEEELILNLVPYDLFLKERRDYCLEGEASSYRVAVCEPDPAKICATAGVCIPKCCGEGEIIIEKFMCTRNESLPLKFHSVFGEELPAPARVTLVGDRLPVCDAGSLPTTQTDISLLVNGKLFNRKNHAVADFDEYCIENDYTKEKGMQTMAVVCLKRESKAMTVKYQFMKAGYVISDVFLIVVILLHVLIPSLRDAQGLILVSHMAAMFVALTVLFVLSMFTNQLHYGLCVAAGFVFQFSFLAMFFWLNIMCFDIWRVIRATARGIPLLGILGSDARKFRLYCLYGWGCPTVIVVITGIMHGLSENLPEGIIKPGFGTLTCWLPGDLQHLVYCYAYVAALFILDILFIGHTMIVLYQAGNAFMCFARQVSVTAFNRKHLEAFWQRFGLFALMVFCWTTEILSWKITPREIWIVSDIINSLQGFIVFVIFISSKKKREMVMELMVKVAACCRDISSQARPSISSQAVGWHATPVTSNTSSGTEEDPSSTGRKESCISTDRMDSYASTH